MCTAEPPQLCLSFPAQEYASLESEELRSSFPSDRDLDLWKACTEAAEQCCGEMTDNATVALQGGGGFLHR